MFNNLKPTTAESKPDPAPGGFLKPAADTKAPTISVGGPSGGDTKDDLIKKDPTKSAGGFGFGTDANKKPEE